MLDQNTDRMWYVIGAVLVGAAIILIANGTLPQMFASVGGMFEDVISNVQYDFDGNTEDLINKGYIPIATAEELNNVRSATLKTYGKGTEWEKEYEGGLGKKYVQVANIDLSGYSEEGWSPIGTDEQSSFKGRYDGGNYVIRGLEVKGEGKDYQGLFGYTDAATIRNVGLIDNKITGSHNVGGLVGRADSSTIENSYAKGKVTGVNDVGGLVGRSWHGTEISNSYATGSVEGTGLSLGGLVGYVRQGSTITNSYATGSVTGVGENAERNVGGLVGHIYNSTIENSYATGSVTSAGYYVGGLAGRTWDSTNISNSYATGSVTGSHWVGGLVGDVYNSTISNSYATGLVLVNGSGDYVGGLLGDSGDYSGGFPGMPERKGDFSTITSSYWNTETTRQEISDGGEAKTTEQMKQQITYSGWDFDNVWKFDEGDYPKLR